MLPPQPSRLHTGNIYTGNEHNESFAVCRATVQVRLHFQRWISIWNWIYTCMFFLHNFTTLPWYLFLLFSSSSSFAWRFKNAPSSSGLKWEQVNILLQPEMLPHRIRNRFKMFPLLISPSPLGDCKHPHPKALCGFPSKRELRRMKKGRKLFIDGAFSGLDC